MSFVSLILIIAALLIVALIILGVAVKKFRKPAIIISVALVLLAAGIFIISYNMAVSSKNIQTETIRDLESDIKDEFGINSLYYKLLR